MKKWWCLVWLCSMALCLTGCQGTKGRARQLRNVEERDYVTVLWMMPSEGEQYSYVLAIAKAKQVGEKSEAEEISEWEATDLEALEKQYREEKGKELSLAHLKAVLFSAEDSSLKNLQTRKMFMQLDEDLDVAKTLPVLWITQRDKFRQFLMQGEEPVGTYLEKLAKVRKEEKEVSWLKDYLLAIREETEAERDYLVPTAKNWKVQ